MDDPILHNLNPQQYEAVTAADGPLLIIAGAGSGKTRVITRRIAHLVRSRGVRPYEIFAATFTNKAAREMQRRVAELVGETAPREFHIATFHSLCVRILRKEASAAGLSRNFTICDERDQLSAVRHVIRRHGHAANKKIQPSDVQWIVNQCKIRMLGPEGVQQVRQSPLEAIYAQLYEEYLKYMAENSAVDFEDLILCVVRLFQNCPEVLDYYRRRYRHVLVDEYQDTNMVQFELIRLLAGGHRNLCVVGDEDQSIYSWRGAEISNLLDFQKHFPEARLVRLEQNYRSTANILKAADAVIAHNTERLGKHLFTGHEAGPPILAIRARTEFEESLDTAQAIQDLVIRFGYSYSDVAIFYRIAALSRSFEDRLRQLNIPYRVVGGIRFYDRAEIKDMLSYLQVIQNPGNALALRRIVNTPKRGVGEKSLETIQAYAGERGISQYEALQRASAEGLVGKSAGKQIDALLAQLDKWRKMAGTRKVSEILKMVLEETAYGESLGDPESMEVRARLENLDELLNSVVSFEQEIPGAGLQDYLENVTLVTQEETSGDSHEAVSLMTLHSAKGLEFKVVFIVGLEDGVFPNVRAVMEDDRMEEERRLFYVGMTRAKELLVLTRSGSRLLYGETRCNSPSVFWRELPKDIVEPLDLGKQLPSAAGTRAPRTATSSTAHSGAAGPHRVCAGGELGQRVRHPLLGEGTIAGMSGSGKSATILLRLDDGQIHKLLARYANLEFLG